MKRFVFFALIVIAIIVATILYDRTAQMEPGTQATVATTIYPLYDITRNIAGDALNVAYILPPGASPHTFEPTPSFIRQLENVDVVYAIGFGIDDWSQTITQSVGAEQVNVSQNIHLLPHATLLETEDDEDVNNIDPHYWLSVPNAITIAQTVTTDLATRYPEHQVAFKANLASYTEQLTALNNEIIDTLADISNTNIVTIHDGWYYFADAYGLHVSASFEPTAGREPTPQYLVELTQVVQASGTSTIYAEPQLSTAGLEAFAKDNNMTVQEVDPIGGTQGRETYIQLMRFNANQISHNR